MIRMKKKVIIVMTLRLSNFQLESCNCFVSFSHQSQSLIQTCLVISCLYTMSIIIMDSSFSDHIRLSRASTPRKGGNASMKSDAMILVLTILMPMVDMDDMLVKKRSRVF